jgi:hypothetical protein
VWGKRRAESRKRKTEGPRVGASWRGGGLPWEGAGGAKMGPLCPVPYHNYNPAPFSASPLGRGKRDERVWFERCYALTPGPSPGVPGEGRQTPRLVGLHSVRLGYGAEFPLPFGNGI